MSLSVEIKHLFSGFHVDVGFEAPQGVTAVFGPSGAGKSTIVNAVGGLLTPDAGRISLSGRVILDTQSGVNVPPHKRRVGYVFQDARLFPHLSVRNNLLFGQRFAPRSSRIASLAEVVELLGIAPLLERRTAALSGGEKQRVAIGRALLAGPEILLLDEPLASLDEARKGEVLPYLERLSAEARIPMLYVSHARHEVQRLAQTVVEIEAGRVVRQGPVEAFVGASGAAPVRISLPAGSLGPDAAVISFRTSDAMLTAPDTRSGAPYQFEGRITAVEQAADAALVTVVVAGAEIELRQSPEALARAGLDGPAKVAVHITAADILPR